MSFLTSLIAPVANIATGIIKNRGEISKAKHEAKMSQIQNDADWESKMADASANSWKDEWFTLLLSAPVVAVVWGIGMNDVEILDRIGLAFEELNRLPDWYQYLLYIAISASFGVRGVQKFFKR